MPTIAKTPIRLQRSAHNSRDVRSATEGKPEALETPVAEGTLALVGQALETADSQGMTTAVRTLATASSPAAQEKAEPSGKPNNRDSRTTGNISNRRDVNYSNDASNSRDASNIRDHSTG
jgi:hypothetical protein